MNPNKLSYSEQIQAAYRRAKKSKNVEAMAYYRGLGNTSASVSFESFKGSWAYEQWKKDNKTLVILLEIRNELKRFSYLG